MSAKSVWYIEADDNDACFLKRAFQKARLTNPLQVAHDGMEALEFLSGSGKFSDREQ